MTLDEIIRNRRSIRQWKDKEVPQEDLNKILEAARFSPSWANNQPWRFIVVKDKKKIEKIDGRITAPILVIACAKLNESGFLDSEKITDFNEWFMFDMGVAVYGLCLKAHELGYGSVIKGNINHNLIVELLSIPEEFKPIVAVPIGIPNETGRKKERKNLSEIVFSEKFEEKFKS